MRKPVREPHPRDEWDEQQWERFLQRADARAAKFQELLETLVDHPEGDRIIAEEMGWNLKSLSCAEEGACLQCDRRADCEAYEMMLLAGDSARAEEDPDVDSLTDCFDELENVPAYTLSRGFAEELCAFLRSRAAARIHDEDVRAALLCAMTAPAQIAGGHGIGYDGDAINGNIANCKRARRNLAACSEALQQLDLRGLADAADIARLRARAQEVDRAIGQWIDSLRERT